MENKLKISVSGVRGIVDDSLTSEIVLAFAHAFGSYVKGDKVVVARDTRPSGENIKQKILLGLTDTGCSIIDIDIAPTPTSLLMVKQFQAKGGIIITASHNPSGWNGLKFVSSGGVFLTPSEIDELLTICKHRKFRLVNWDKRGNIEKINTQIIAHSHIDKIMGYINTGVIRKKRFKVALDSCNGAGAVITPMLLKELGCEVIPMNTETNGLFPHNPEPLPENLINLCDLVKEKKADIGFAQDPDADRLAIVSEKGECIGEEYTLALATQFVLKRKYGIVVTNLSTTKAIDDIAKQYNAKVLRSKIGEINVVEMMMRHNAILGGEGNGGVIVPEIVYARDSLSAIGIILQHLAESNMPVSQLVTTIPQYKMVKTKLEYPEDKIFSLLEKIKDKYKNNPINVDDGVKIDFLDSWLHIRPSNTEPIVRIIAEAKTIQDAEILCNGIKHLASI